MTTNHHTPIANGASANADTFNNRLEELDQAITDIVTTEKDGHVIQDEGTDITQQQRLNFVGAGVSVTNDAPNNRTVVTVPGGVTDHSSLSGLADDDHPQYHNDTRGDARYLRSYSGIVYVKGYGATGDGVTVDTSAIQAAIDACSAGDAVIFTPGIYLTDSLTYKPGVAMIGTGPRAVTLKANSNSQKLISYTAASTQSHFDISGFGFDSNSKTGCYGISLDGVDNAKRLTYVRIEKIHMIGTFADGIYLKCCANTQLQHVFMSAVALGIVINNCADTTLVDCNVQQGSSYGFQILGGAGAYDEGLRMIGCSTNGQAAGLYASGQDWSIVADCSFTTCAAGAVILSNCDNWKIANCELSVAGTPAAAGLNVDSTCDKLIVTNCLISLCTFGMVLAGTKHVISNNQFEANTNIDLYLNVVTKSAFHGNICDSTGAAQSVYEVAGSNYNAIIGNVINGTIVTVGAQTVSANNITY